MDLSIRTMYRQHGKSSGVISVRQRNSLHSRLPGSIKQAQRVFSSRNTGDGFRCGCKTAKSLKVDLKVASKNFGEVVPSWVAADHRDHRTGGSERTVGGILSVSKISGTDFPPRPWHHDYDWNYHVKVDKEFFYLNSPVNKDYNVKTQTSEMECEWDSKFVPHWARPMQGDRVQITGRWIHDCGHPKRGKHRSEIHPPKATICFRDETDKFRGNRGLSRSTQAIVYISKKGGYIDLKINDQDYIFDLPLPGKPSAASRPVFKIVKKIRSPINPVVTPFPSDDPKVLRVTVPLKGKFVKGGQYGVIVSGGWTDPKGIDAKRIKKVTVNITKANLKANKDPSTLGLGGKDEWRLHTGINGRWKQYKSMDRGKRNLNHKVELHLHSSQRIKIATCGYEADAVDDIMGRGSGAPSSYASSSKLTSGQRKDAAKRIAVVFLTLGTDLLSGGDIENDSIGRVAVNFRKGRGSGTSTRTFTSSKKDYTIEVKVK